MQEGCVYVQPTVTSLYQLVITDQSLRALTHTILLSALRQAHSPIPNPILHPVPSSASSLTPQYPLVYLRSSNSCLVLLPRLRITSILPLYLPLQ